MQSLNELSKLVGAMSPGALLALVILAGFGLAAYAIYAVLTITKGK